MSKKTTFSALDIRNVISGAQNVIDAAVATVTATRSTQNTLEYNIKTTDAKVSGHNADPESHEDIRLRLAEMPSMISDPRITGVNSIETGTEGTWNLYSEPSPVYTGMITISKFKVYGKDGELLTELKAVDGSANFVYTFTGDRNEVIQFAVQAVGGPAGSPEAYTSSRAAFDLTITHHLPPDMSEMRCTLPANITEGNTYTFRIGNIVDLDNDLESIVLSCSDVRLTFNQTTLQQNTDYTLTVDEGYNGPADIPIIFTAHDEWGLESTARVMVHLNALPVASGFSHTFPTYPNPNTSYIFKVFGVTDPDDAPENLRCSIVADNPAVTFIKSSNIALNEDITCNIGEIAATTPIALTCTFTDKDNGIVVTTINAIINTPPNTSALVVTKPHRLAPNQPDTITVSGATDANGEAVTYDIINTNPAITFSKVTGIVDNEAVTVTASSEAVRGQTYNFNIVAVDASNGRTPVTESLIINTLPDVSAATCTIPPFVVPASAHTVSVSGATDVDAQALTYTVTSSNPNVGIVGATEIEAGTEFTITAPTAEQLPRGQSFDLIITVSDGQETINKTIPIGQNQLPVAEGTTTTLPERIIPNGSYQIRFNNGTDPDLESVTYTLVDYDDSVFSFSKLTNIAASEEITMNISGVAVRGQTYSVGVRVVDAAGEYTTTSFNTLVNTLTDVSTTTCSIPAIIIPSSVHEGIVVAGATDVDSSDTLTMTVTGTGGTIVTGADNVPFGTPFTVTIPQETTLPRGSQITLTVAVNDGYETVTKEFFTVVNTLPDMSAVVDSLLHKVEPDTTYDNITFSGATDVNGQDLTYTITADNGVVVNNGTGIAAGALVTIITPAEDVLARAQPFNLTVTVFDGLESNSTTITHYINQLPVLTGMTHNIPAVAMSSQVLSGLTINGITDPDNDPITVTITSDNPNVVIGGGTNIPQGTAFTVTVPTPEQLARGKTFNLIVTASDGFNTQSSSVPVRINQVVDVTSVVTSLPATMQGGQEHAVNFTITGGTEPDGQTYTFNIVNADPKLTFSKTTAINIGEAITVKAMKVNTDTVMTFEVSATDNFGETGDTKQFSITVQPIIVTAPPTITSPVEGAKLDYDAGTDIAWTAIVDMIDMDNDHAYPWN